MRCWQSGQYVGTPMMVGGEDVLEVTVACPVCTKPISLEPGKYGRPTMAPDHEVPDAER